MIINPKDVFISFILLGLCICTACKQQKNGNTKKQVAQGYDGAILSKCIQPDILKFTGRVDTVSSDSLKTYHFGLKHTIVCVFETNPLTENNTRNFYDREKIYDTLGRTVYEKYSQGLPVYHLECYNYTYDSEGFLISKEGYEAAETNSYIIVQYKNGKEIRRVKSLRSMPSK